MDIQTEDGVYAYNKYPTFSFFSNDSGDVSTNRFDGLTLEDKRLKIWMKQY